MAEWLSYQPGGLIQERKNLYAGYEIWMPELNLEVGRVESYYGTARRLKWRTLDHWKCDFRDGYSSREKAAQELVQQCPRTVELVQARRQRGARSLRAE